MTIQSDDDIVQPPQLQHLASSPLVARLKRHSNQARTGLHLCIATVSNREIVHFLHIGKTGGTAIKDALLPHRLGPSALIRLHSHGVRLYDIPPGQKVFFFLRDPASRFVSAFHSRKRESLPRFYVPWNTFEREAFHRYETPDQLACAISSNDPNERAPALRAMRSIGHVNAHYCDWLSDEQYLLSRKDDILFVGFQESLSADFTILKQKLSLPRSASLPRDEVRSHRNPPMLSRVLSPTALAGLRLWYDYDYHLIDVCRQLRHY